MTKVSTEMSIDMSAATTTTTTMTTNCVSSGDNALPDKVMAEDMTNNRDTVAQLNNAHQYLRHLSMSGRAGAGARSHGRAHSIFHVFGSGDEAADFVQPIININNNNNNSSSSTERPRYHSSTFSMQSSETLLKLSSGSFDSYDLNVFGDDKAQQTQPPPPALPPPPRTRTSSVMSLSRNRNRILAMLDDVKRKRRMRNRRKSDIMQYLDEFVPQEELLHTTANNNNGHRPSPATKKSLVRHPYWAHSRVYQFLNHPSSATPLALIYHVTVFVIVLCCLILTIWATVKVPARQENIITAVYLLEKVVITWFSLEFVLKLWSCSCKKPYRGFRGKLTYILVPSRLIDLLVLVLTTVVLFVNPSSTGHEVFVVSAFRGFHRFFQVAQVLTLKRSLKPWKILASVIYDQREQLFIILYTEFIVLCTLAYLAFLVERDNNQNFESIADSMWWAIVTLSTVGYGDRVPQTWLGKMITTIFTILGVAIFALPAGIIGTGLALKIEEEERNQIRDMKKVSAAVLIQRAWRAHIAHENHLKLSKFFHENPMQIFKQHGLNGMVLKFITLAQFAIARNRFRELMRPLDLKTVVQSYRDGQTEVLLRSKLLQQCVEELGRRLEKNENRVANMSMRLETKQNVADQRLDTIAHLLETINRRLLANNVLIHLNRPSSMHRGDNHNNNSNSNSKDNSVRATRRAEVKWTQAPSSSMSTRREERHVEVKNKKSVPLPHHHQHKHGDGDEFVSCCSSSVSNQAGLLLRNRHHRRVSF